MSRKNSARNRRDEQGSPPRRMPLKIGIVLGIIVLGGAALGRSLLGGGDNPASSGPSAEMTQSGSSGSSLPPPAPGTKVPLNDVDPTSGKPVTATSPTIAYKGYQIGFCCADSEGYRGSWALMSESKKDAFVRRYLK